ncbi:hypothetical protein [Nocardioides aquiterrae]|uniref:Uncharacterized protein n=1 Tax=Nocardioides aquiterrae TaxID=203799 RepID=A0ABN1UF73_9ACTN
MTTGDRDDHVHEELAAALAAVAEHARLTARLERARAAETEAAAASSQARGRLAEETADVEALESFSPTRVWAALRGSRDADLDREQAEKQAAEYAVARADAVLQAARDEVRRAETGLAALGDVAGRRDRALQAKEDSLVGAGGPVAAELTRIAGELGTADAEAAEVAEAAAAGEIAATCLARADELLGKAGDWASYDTFLGGGMFTDAMKYDRMDQAQRLLHDADLALRRFAHELADVGLQATVQGLSVDGLTQAFDVWFDNIFTDWSVKNRISDAARRTAEAAQAVHDLRVRLDRRQRELADRQAALRAERERLLAG